MNNSMLVQHQRQETKVSSTYIAMEHELKRQLLSQEVHYFDKTMNKYKLPNDIE